MSEHSDMGEGSGACLNVQKYPHSHLKSPTCGHIPPPSPGSYGLSVGLEVGGRPGGMNGR